jgi:hypothetical protein
MGENAIDTALNDLLTSDRQLAASSGTPHGALQWKNLSPHRSGNGHD